MPDFEKAKSDKHKQLERASLESPDFSPSDHRGALIFEKNANLIGNDAVFKKIFNSVIKGWNNIDKEQRKNILDLIEELIETLKNYYISYRTLKSKARKREDVENYISVDAYQSEVERADRLERALHNSFVDAINILSRKMKEMGLDNSWRQDDSICGLTPEATRAKAKDWMFKIFREKI